MQNVKLFDFFKNNFTEDFIMKYSVILFKSDVNCYIFFEEFFKKFKVVFSEKININSIELTEQSFGSIVQILEMSFLGQRYFYNIKVAESDVKLIARFNKYLQTYNGPHTIFFVSKLSSNSFKENILIIDFPSILNFQEYVFVYNFLYSEQPESSFVKALFSKKSNFTLDEFCLIIKYQKVVGKNFDIFFKDYFYLLLSPDHSLFLLSQYLFAKQPKLFFDALSKLEKLYPPEFWIVFWSEQIWQSIIFINHVNNYGIMAAKTVVSRLPFSFINKDWKRHNIPELVLAYEALYKFDYNFKNGASSMGLYLWYHSFFYNKQN